MELTELTQTKDFRTLTGVSCVVLGGGGFIGTHLCRALVRVGASVRGYGRSQVHPGALEGVAWSNGDFGDDAKLTRAILGCEVVFHLLGGSTPESSNVNPLNDLISSTAASVRLFEICRITGVRKVVFVSSGGTVYGVPRQVPIREDARTDPISAYGISKLATEKYLHLYHYLYGLDYAIMRVANPFGPYQSPARRQGLIAALLSNAINDMPIEIWGDGQVVRDYVYVGDMVDALLRVVDYKGAHRVFNVGAGVGRSVSQVVDDIEHVLGDKRLERIYKPGRATDVPVNVLDVALIEAELGWKPATRWSDALKKTADWIESAH